MATALACRYIKTTTSDDLFGTEISAILKNVFDEIGGFDFTDENENHEDNELKNV